MPRESWFKARSNKKLPRPHLNKKKGGAVVHACHPSYAGGISRKIMVQGDQGKNHKTLPEK
jgi:hypothetical protein